MTGTDEAGTQEILVELSPLVIIKSRFKGQEGTPHVEQREEQCESFAIRNSWGTLAPAECPQSPGGCPTARRRLTQRVNELAWQGLHWK